jgi:hypothetical protein
LSSTIKATVWQISLPPYNFITFYRQNFFAGLNTRMDTPVIFF